MKTVMLLTLVSFGNYAAANAQYVAGKTFVCGKKTIAFDSTARTATVGKSKYDVGWGNRMIDATVGDHYVVFSSTDEFELDDVPCRRK